MEGYKVTINKTSKELTTKERIAIKDFSNATPLDTALETDNDSLIITPSYYAILDVHNEKAKDNPDYRKYVIVDKSGQKYVTGSESFWTSFSDIMDEISAEEMDEDFSIECFKRPSKNYKGKSFISCSII